MLLTSPSARCYLSVYGDFVAYGRQICSFSGFRGNNPHLIYIRTGLNAPAEYIVALFAISAINWSVSAVKPVTPRQLLHGVQEKLIMLRCAQWHLLEHQRIAVATGRRGVSQGTIPQLAFSACAKCVPWLSFSTAFWRVPWERRRCSAAGRYKHYEIS